MSNQERSDYIDRIAGEATDRRVQLELISALYDDGTFYAALRALYRLYSIDALYAIEHFLHERGCTQQQADMLLRQFGFATFRRKVERVFARIDAMPLSLLLILGGMVNRENYQEFVGWKQAHRPHLITYSVAFSSSTRGYQVYTALENHSEDLLCLFNLRYDDVIAGFSDRYPTDLMLIQPERRLFWHIKQMRHNLPDMTLMLFGEISRLSYYAELEDVIDGYVVRTSSSYQQFADTIVATHRRKHSQQATV